MKIAIFSDIHGNDIALRSVLDDIRFNEINNLIFLGDMVAKGPNPKNCIDIMRELSFISRIQGNTDDWHNQIPNDWIPNNPKEEMLYQYFKYMDNEINDDDIDFITNIPDKANITLERSKILCVHGSPRLQWEGIHKEINDIELKKMISGVDADIILCGHTHEPVILNYKDITIINVGSVGMSYDMDNRASYVILEICDGKIINIDIKRIYYDIKSLIKSVQDKAFPNADKYIEILKTAKVV